MRIAMPTIALFPLLAACGPIPVERAERECFQRAHLAASPRGMIAVGTGTSGPRVKGDISISSDFIQGKDPSALYDACVFQKSGQPPRRPLYTRPDWKG
ncbi:hypothetical protein [Defluviimonas sp. SAOS-178_SWC]|uniref:hypothetical protein n=1 Tax=Defluviimonas sp. SAOS-178_SWC TaxID=3121287 RepID=UPI0032217E3D